MTEDMERQLKRFDLKVRESAPTLSNLTMDISKLTIEVSNAIKTFSSFTDTLSGLMLNQRRMEKAMKWELVSRRVVKLTYHKRTRISKKNIHRILREVKLYEKRYGENNLGPDHCGEGDRQSQESDGGETG